MSDALVRCNNRNYGIALGLFDEIKRESNHKTGTVMDWMKEYSRRCDAG